MADPNHFFKEHEAQRARFEDFIKNPKAYRNTAAPTPKPAPTRRITFIGRDHEDGLEVRHDR